MIPPVLILAGEMLPWIFIGLGCFAVWVLLTADNEKFARRVIAFMVLFCVVGAVVGVCSL